MPVIRTLHWGHEFTRNLSLKPTLRAESESLSFGPLPEFAACFAFRRVAFRDAELERKIVAVDEYTEFCAYNYEFDSESPICARQASPVNFFATGEGGLLDAGRHAGIVQEGNGGGLVS